MRLTVCLAALAAGSLVLGAAAQERSLPPRDSFHLFLLAGQSNMAGRGVDDAQDPPVTTRVRMLDRLGQWVPAADPMHFDKPIAGVGLGRAFAAAMAERHPDVTIGLIPAAVGGSPISAWQPGALDEPTGTHPWDDAIARARIAMRDGTLRAILWHQGESDATPALAPPYRARLHALIARFRDVLDAPRLPFIVGQVGQFEGAPWDEARRTIDQAHRTLPDQVPYTAYVSADGLSHKGDRLHFDAPSLRIFGRRYAEALLTLTARP